MKEGEIQAGHSNLARAVWLSEESVGLQQSPWTKTSPHPAFLAL